MDIIPQKMCERNGTLATSRSRRLSTILNLYEWVGKKHFVPFKLEGQSGGPPQTQASKFEPWRSEAEPSTSRSQRLPTVLHLYE